MYRTLPPKKDWKLFGRNFGMAGKLYEPTKQGYMELLSQEGKNPSDIFWELDSRIKQ